MNSTFWLHPIRIFAISMVVLSHLSGGIVQQFHQFSGSWWWSANFFQSLAKVAVPLLFMVSGALLLNPAKEESIRNFFKKRLKKLVPDFILWSFLYYSVFQGNPLTLSGAGAFLKSFLTGDIYYHLWFIYTILGFYLAVPILRVYIQNAPRKHLIYWLLLWATIHTFLPQIKLFTGIQIKLGAELITRYSGFFILGYYLQDIELNGKKGFWFFLLVIPGLLMTVFGTYLLMKSRSGSYQDFFYQYNSLNILLMSVSIFLFAKYFIGKKKFSDKFKKKILFFSGLTYGVYLSHVLLIEIFIRYGGFMNPRNPGFHPLAAIPILLFLVLAGSVVLSYFGKKRLWLPRLHARLVESVRQKSDKKKKSFQ